MDTSSTSVLITTQKANTTDSGRTRQCAGCDGAILGTCFVTGKQSYHPEHFVCSGCGERLYEFYPSGDRNLCRRCYGAECCLPCRSCKQPVIDRVMKTRDGWRCVDCFVCSVCSVPIGPKYYHIDGRLYCARHLLAALASEGRVSTPRSRRASDVEAMAAAASAAQSSGNSGHLDTLLDELNKLVAGPYPVDGTPGAPDPAKPASPALAAGISMDSSEEEMRDKLASLAF